MTLDDLRALLLPAMGEELTERTLDALVRLAPGETLYVSKRIRAPEIGPRDTAETVRLRYGVSRATAYNWVSAYRRSRR